MRDKPPQGRGIYSKPEHTSRRHRRWWFRLAAFLVVPAIFFVTLEFGLRLCGTGYPSEFFVPLAGRPGFVVDNYRFAWRFFPKPLARAPQPILVAKAKPRGTKRVLVLGASAAMGDPEPAFGLSRLLQVLLDSRFPNHDFEVINTAVTAINSHVVLPIARECQQLAADAWVVYLGNNEVHGPFGPGTVFGGQNAPLWLVRGGLAVRQTKIGQLISALPGSWTDSSGPKSWGGMEMFLEHQIRHDDPALQRVYANYRRNLTDILRTAASAEIPVVVSTVVTNLKDLPPFASLHHGKLNTADHQRWEKYFVAGCQAQSRGDLPAALRAFDQAAKIDAEYAELEYRQGQCHLALGNTEKASEKFRLARDHDALRFRADSMINGIIRSVASEAGEAVVLVDACEKLASEIPDGIVGDELLHEHVHLNFTGNYRLAKLLASEVSRQLDLRAEDEAEGWRDWPSEARCAELLGLTPYHRLLLIREMHGRLRLPPFNRQLDHDLRLDKLKATAADLSASLSPDIAQQAIDQYQQLIEDRTDDWVLLEQFSVLLDVTGKLDEAIEQQRQVTRQLVHHPDGFVRFGVLLNRAKKWKEAEKVLRQALALRPDFARAANSLGICLSHQGRYDESYEQFRRAVELQPTFAEAFFNWGLVLDNQGDDGAAMERYKAAIAADKDYFPAHDRLGKNFVTAGNPQAALPHYLTVVRLKPNDSVAHLNLGLLYLKIGEHDAEALEQFQRTVELDPDNLHARQALDYLAKPPSKR